MQPIYLSLNAAQRWLITIAVMSATLMQVLDTTIVNVALPHMQGSLNAAPDQISWTLTSYLVASGIFMPLTGYLTDRLGRKKYLTYSIAGFTLASVLCGAAHSLTQMVLFRLLQGIFGAGLVPLSQAILTDIYSPEERGKAMAIWAIGVMVGPILGPTLGGYLTDVVNWRWTFYVNVPIGLFALLLAWQVVPETATKKRGMDWFGLSLISIAIGATQYLLDRGNQEDWFNARSIQLSLILALGGLLGFLLHSLKQREHIVFDVRIFKDRNFTIASILLALFGLGLYGSMVIQPLFLEDLLNYPVLIAGLVMAPRGISSLFSNVLVGKLLGHIDPRWLIATGVGLSALGVSVGAHYTTNISTWWFIWPLLIQGFGLGMVFVPLSTMAFLTLSQSARTEAAGIFSLMRTLGSSIGIALTITVLTRHTQIAWNQLGGFIHPYNPALLNYLQPLHLKANDASAALILGNELAKQAQMIAFIDAYKFIEWSFLAMLPLLLLLRRPKSGSSLR